MNPGKIMKDLYFCTGTLKTIDRSNFLNSYFWNVECFS